MIARNILIVGKVQGVFFREWTVSRAREYGVSGYVRNRTDGGVEVFVQGEENAVERFTARLHEGPPAAKVKELAIEPAETQRLDSFTRRSTV